MPPKTGILGAYRSLVLGDCQNPRELPKRQPNAGIAKKTSGGGKKDPGLATPLAWYKCQNSQNAQKCLRESAKGVFGPPE